MSGSASYTLDGSHHSANGCCTDLIPNPMYGDLYFKNCPVKICIDSFVLHGSMHVQEGCSVTFTGDVTVYGSVAGNPVIEGEFSEIAP